MNTVYRNGANFASINLGLLLFFALKPYPVWMLPNGLTQIVFFTTTLLAIILGNYSEITNKKIAFISICFYLVYFTLPIVHQFKSGYFLYYLVFIQILFFNKEVYLNGYLVLKKIIVIVSLAALFMWFLHLLGLDLPHYVYYPDFRYSSLDNYHIYGLSLSMYRGGVFVGSGGLERINGVFAEPGHYGIYLGLLMAVEKFEFDSKENIILLIAGILTFSTAFYGILSLGIAYRLLSNHKTLKDIRTFFVIALILVPFMAGNDLYYENAIGRVTKTQGKDDISIQSIVDNRTTKSTVDTYQKFSSGDKFLTGVGVSEDKDVQITNWRGYIYRFGIIGLVLASIMVFFITKGTNIIYQGLLIAIAALIFSHRSYIMYQPGIYMMLFVANMISNHNNEEEFEKSIE